MEQNKLDEFNKEISELLTKYNCTLQVAHTIQVVPNKPMEETTQEVTEVVEETAEVTGTDETTEEVA